jgi:lincosamide nucleotidyltransferase A/C/D/E
VRPPLISLLDACGLSIRLDDVTTSQADVLWMLDVVASVRAVPVVAGGWGIDALVGAQTREHRDLDLLVPAPFVESLVQALEDASFVVTTDWLPVRVELTDSPADRHIDIHPAVDDGKRGWWQHGFDGARFETPAAALTGGVIGGRRVRCLTAAKQLELHQGYPLGPDDLADIEVLRGLLP